MMGTIVLRHVVPQAKRSRTSRWGAGTLYPAFVRPSPHPGSPVRLPERTSLLERPYSGSMCTPETLSGGKIALSSASPHPTAGCYGPSSLGHLLQEMSNPYSCWLGCFRCKHCAHCAERNAAGSCLPSGRFRRLVTIMFTCNTYSYGGFVCGFQLPRPSASSMGTPAWLGHFSRPCTVPNAGGPGSLITLWMVHELLTCRTLRR